MDSQLDTAMLEDGIDMSHPDYKLVKHLGSGSFGIAKLMCHQPTGELVAVKFLERGPQIDKKVEREIVNHRALLHPNVIRFNEVFLTSSHLGIAMEYAAGGELFDRIAGEGRFSEGEARFFFQQLVAGVQHCHSQGVCHRDLKLENALLDGLGLAPRLMICDFGYSKSAYFDSQPKSTVGTPNYLAPELLTRGASYDGQLADVWSCGVTLFVMLVGRYPFDDPSDPTFRRCIQRIRSAIYSIPSDVRLTRKCRDLISQIFVADPSQRITMEGIQRHPWFLENLTSQLQVGASTAQDSILQRQQSMDVVRAVVREAQLRPPPEGP